MRRVLHDRLPRRGDRQHEGLGGEHVDHAEQRALVQQGEAQHQDAAGQQMGEIVVEAGREHRYPPRPRYSSTTASSASSSAPPRNSPTRNTRILATMVSDTASKLPPTSSLAR